MKFVSIVLLSAAILCAQNLSKLGFTGSGGEDLVAEKILGRWYALEGNYVDLRPYDVDYQGPNSLRPDRPLPPSGVRVIREVAKLDARAEDDPNYIPRKLETDAITVFAGRAIMHTKTRLQGLYMG